MKICAIILSAGRSKRFNSTLPKYLHTVAGQPIINYNIDALKKIKNLSKIEIISNKESKKTFQNLGINAFIQNPVNGTGGAIQQFFNSLKIKYDYYLIVLSDTPIFESKTINQFVNQGIKTKIDLSVLSQKLTNPKGYGRVITDNGKLISIIEENDCNSIESKINLVNTGIFLLSKKSISKINLIKKNKNKKEYYITDLIELCHKSNLKINTFKNRGLSIQGINTKLELQNIENSFQLYLKEKLTQQGVRFIQPETVYIENNVKISRGAIIEPNVVIKKNVNIGKETVVKSFSYLEDCSLGNNCQIGPFARIRPESKISNNAKIGNFVEIKKANLSEGVKVNHLSYIGDTHIGKNSNIGAGTITCNYDGKNKLSCKIGNDCFIGSNTSIIAPVKIGNKAYVAAGSTITKNILNDQFSISRAKQKNLRKFKISK